MQAHNYGGRRRITIGVVEVFENTFIKIRLHIIGNCLLDLFVLFVGVHIGRDKSPKKNIK